MGQTLSLSSGLGRSGQDGEDGGTGSTSGAVYKYPPKGGGHYFSSHFIMGGEKFDSPQPESFLFGENSDLNLLGSRPVAFPYPPPQANEPTKTLRSLINIRKDSVYLVPIKTSADGGEVVKYNIKFTFDSDVRCAVTVYYFCLEEVHSCGVTYAAKRADLVSDTYVYQRGAAQVFDQPSHVFEPAKCSQELSAVAAGGEGNDGRFPVAIHCVSLEGDAPRQSHTTIGTLEPQEDGSVTLKNIKQKLFVDGLNYFLQEIYGLENKVPDSRPALPDDDDMDDCGAECVVCMCDLRDTIILPCRHLCLCNACADSLRYQANNCPICRAPFRALLQIRAVQKVSQGVTHPALADPADVAQEGIPPGYQAVSLVEALNGPISVAPAMPVQVSIPAEKKSKKRNGKKASKSNNAAAAARAGEDGAVENPAGAEGSAQEGEAAGGGGDVSEVTIQRDEPKIVSSTGSKVSIKIVNETLGGENSSSSCDGNKTTLIVDATASSSRSSVDVVEEELANMSPQGSKEVAAKQDIANPVESSGAAAESEDVDEAIVVNLSSDAGEAVPLRTSSRPRTASADAPGTPTSARSSQDSSASAASSTKPLLAGGTAGSTQQQTSSGMAIIVKVHPTSAEGGEDFQAQEDEDDESRVLNAQV